MDAHISDSKICENGCSALSNMTANRNYLNQLILIYFVFLAENQVRAGEAGAIGVILRAMTMNVKKQDLCIYGCEALGNITSAVSRFQMEVLDKDGITVFTKISSVHMENAELMEYWCNALGTIFSSKELYDKYCNQDIIEKVEECFMLHKDSEAIKQFFLGLKREDDQKVKYLVGRDMCTKKGFPKCSSECKCDEGFYCPKCCIQQKAFRCHTCDKSDIKFYCEACWKRDHNDHDCEEFFYPVRCATKTDL